MVSIKWTLTEAKTGPIENAWLGSADRQPESGWVDKNSLRGKPMDRPPPQKTGNQDNEDEKREETDRSGRGRRRRRRTRSGATRRTTGTTRMRNRMSRQEMD